MALYTQKEIEEELAETFKNGMYNNRTTFAMDFNIANHFGIDAIKDTFKRAFDEWKNDIVYLTELALVCQAFCWHYHEENNDDLSELYGSYYYKCYDHVYIDGDFSDDEKHYYFRCTD